MCAFLKLGFSEILLPVRGEQSYEGRTVTCQKSWGTIPVGQEKRRREPLPKTPPVEGARGQCQSYQE